MNTRSTLIMLIAAVVMLTAFVFVWRFGNAPTDQPDQPGQSRLLFDRDQYLPAAVRQIELKSRSASIKLERHGDRWQWVEPIQWPADPIKVQQLINAVGQIQLYTQVTDTDQLNAETAQTRTPKLTLTLSGTLAPGGQTFCHRLVLGKTAPAGRAYMQVDQQPGIAITSRHLHAVLTDPSLSALRLHRLPALSEPSIRGMTLTVEGQTPVTLAQDNQQWQMTEPQQGPADHEAVRSLVKAFNNVQILRFVAETRSQAEQLGMDQPTVALTLQGDVDGRLTVGKPTDSTARAYFASWSNTPGFFIIAAEQVKQLSVTVDQLRDPQLLPFDARAMTGIRLTHRRGLSDIHLQREVDRWVFAKPRPDYGLSQITVSQLLNVLQNTRAVAFVKSDQPGTPLLTLTATAVDPYPPVTLHVSAYRPGQWLIRRNDEQIAHVVLAEPLDLLMAPTYRFRARQVLALADDQVQSLQIIRHRPFAQTMTIERDTTRSPWQSAVVASDAMLKILALLTPLNTEQWVGPLPDDCRLQAEINIKCFDNQRHTVRLFADPQGQIVGQLDDQSVTFDPGPLKQWVNRELQSPLMVNLNVDQIAEVAAGPVVAVRSTQGLYSLKGGRKIDEQAVAAMFATLAGLSAEHRLPDKSVVTGKPTRVLSISTRAGRKITVQLWPAQAGSVGQPVAQVDRGPQFTITPSQFTQLTASWAK